MKYLLGYLFIVFSFIVHAEPPKKQHILIALPLEANPPYSYGPVHKEKGIYIETIKAIFANTPYSIKFEYLSSARIRSAFVENKIDIECCPLPSWRENETNVSTYTIPLYTTFDILVYSKKPSKQETKTPLATHDIHLESLTVGTIHGYGYKNDDLFTRYDMPSERSLLKMLAHERIDVAIADQNITRHWQKIDNLNIELGPIYEKANRPLRIHHSKAHIIPTLNQSIKTLQQQGQLQAIIESY